MKLVDGARTLSMEHHRQFLLACLNCSYEMYGLAPGALCVGWQPLKPGCLPVLEAALRLLRRSASI